MNEIWPWVVAIDAFDFADPAPLSSLLSGNAEVPHEVRPVLAEIVNGTRKPNLKAASKLRIPAAERMKIAGMVSFFVGMLDFHSREHFFDQHGELVQGALLVADREGIEVITAIRVSQAEARQAVQDTAEELSVSVETIENLVRHLHRKIKSFPIL